ncbi:hydroxypyruvate isomerase family protein [Novosphingobium flavum]|uniref:Hydroxypyruvate isomerase family protein n=1 Tax=Novosphingobium flavum TaxID=1778672 RepID=A0A7X1FUX6_9SPHN|nr:2-oxo-tetronate isomerase [Novosphingobium flavum]MBC2667450.1 hydroxypyruvate isomerase family protein [Novosphingobium flavum]
MTRLAANLTMLFTDLPFLDRFAAAAAAGFKAVECVSPYGEPAETVAERMRAAGLTFALFNMPPGDWAAGDRGYAANPARAEEFRASIETALTYARATSCKTLHLMAGKIPVDADRAAWTATLIANIRLAADAVAGDGITLVLEPINTRVDIPGYFYDRSAAVMDIIEQVGRDNVQLLFDIYHLQVMEGDLARSIERLLPKIGHIQLADNPGRHEPGSGEINFGWLLPRIDALGYEGWVGCEYAPATTTTEGLGWARPYLG